MNTFFLASRPPRVVLLALLTAAWLLLATGCASSPAPAVEKQIAPTTDTRRAIVSLALEQLKAPYQPGAAGPNAFNSSGLAAFAYRGAGAQLPRGAQAQLDAGEPIDMAQAQPADLVFVRVQTTNGGTRLLVGLYTQAGQMLMATPGTRGDPGTRLVDLGDSYWRQRLVGVIRVLPATSR